MKVMYIDFVISTYCQFNCPYCYLDADQRKDSSFASISKIKMNLLQLMVSWRKFNYERLVISITGDELHMVPDAIAYTREIINMIKKVVNNIPRKNIKLKMHTNCNASKEYYIELMPILKTAHEFSNMEYEIVYQSMYHCKRKEAMFNFIHDINTVDLISSYALLDQSQLEKCSHMKFDTIHDFSAEWHYPHFVNDNRNYIVFTKDGNVANKCGHQMSTNLLAMEDREFCNTCPNDECIIIDSTREL
jgi:hypothetical protein